MSLRFLLIAAPACVVLLGLSGAPKPVELTDPYTPSLAVLVACGHCHTCTEPGVGQGHDMHNQTPYDLEGGDHPCFGNVSCGVHWACGTGGEENDEAQFQAMLTALEDVGRGDVKAAVALLDAYPQHVHFNANRSRIQVSALCSSAKIVAQAPLSTAQLQAVQESVEWTSQRASF